MWYVYNKNRKTAIRCSGLGEKKKETTNIYNFLLLVGWLVGLLESLYRGRKYEFMGYLYIDMEKK